MRIGDREDIVVRPVEKADFDELSAVLARAFEDDPIFAWLLPEPSTRLRRLTALYRAFVPRIAAIGFAETTTTEKLQGGAIWMGPEKWEPPTTAMLGAVPGMLKAAGVSAVMKLMAGMSAIAKAHPKDQPHWYLSGLATDPAHQRSGVGTALVSPKLEVCDREGLPAYLETQKEANVPYYERFGFRVRSEMDLPKGGPHLWLMWRDPQ